jgi:alanine dehydrogenase
MSEQDRPVVSIGFPRMQKEPGERRDFLPSFVARLEKLGARVVLEDSYGHGLGLSANDYRAVAPGVTFGDHAHAYDQDVAVVLRCPTEDEIRLMRPGACLISMLHYPTRPGRVAFLKQRGLEAISLDSIKDDSGRRLIENLRAVAWNGLEAAFNTLAQTYPHPGFESPFRDPIHVTLLGAGAVGREVLGAAVRYADDDRRARFAAREIPGVIVTTVDYDLTGHADRVRRILAQTDILVDATQRPDPSRAVIPNAWLAWLPMHAVILDLSADPYDCSTVPPQVKGIEGVPQGDLDQYVFAPDDAVYNRLPACVNRANRRHVVSCYSWPGVHPKACMELYGRQLRPLMRVLLERGGVGGIRPYGRFFERALARAQLSRWPSS